ncbi:AlbA family DNA-binding domain-containing protein [Nocardia asteroides]
MQPAETSAVVAEPVVSEEKITALLAVGTELINLDFKREVDLNDQASLVEFAKDVAAMRSCGGYILIGADDRGTPTGHLSEHHAKQFDEANLRQKLEKFLHPPQVIAAQHTIGGNHLVLVYVPRHALGFTVVKSLGEYTKPNRKYPEKVLRPGDVFIRRQTSSVRWEESEVEALLAGRDALLREDHRREFAATVAAIESGARGRSIARGPSQALSWHLDQVSFDNAVLELLRDGDLVPVRLLILRAAADALTAAETEDLEQYRAILDRLVSLAGLALTAEKQAVAASAIDELAAVYQAPPTPRSGDPKLRALLWLEILFRAEALGALAMRLGQWDVITKIALQPSPDPHWAIWFGHGMVMGHRNRQFPTLGGDDEGGGLIAPARRIIHRLPALRPYVVDDSAYDPQPGAAIGDRDPVLDALCGFDAIAALVITTRPDRGDARPPSTGSDFYPSFGSYYARRSEPWWAKLVTDLAFRAAVLGEVGDDVLGDALWEVAARAESADATGFGVWSLTSAPVRALIDGAQRRDRQR